MNESYSDRLIMEEAPNISVPLYYFPPKSRRAAYPIFMGLDLAYWLPKHTGRLLVDFQKPFSYSAGRFIQQNPSVFRQVYRCGHRARWPKR